MNRFDLALGKKLQIEFCPTCGDVIHGAGMEDCGYPLCECGIPKKYFMGLDIHVRGAESTTFAVVHMKSGKIILDELISEPHYSNLISDIAALHSRTPVDTIFTDQWGGAQFRDQMRSAGLNIKIDVQNFTRELQARVENNLRQCQHLLIDSPREWMPNEMEALQRAVWLASAPVEPMFHDVINHSGRE